MEKSFSSSGKLDPVPTLGRGKVRPFMHVLAVGI
jgi:hypothetical protein